MSTNDEKKAQRLAMLAKRTRSVGELLGYQAASLARSLGVELDVTACDDHVLLGVALETAVHESMKENRAELAHAFADFAGRRATVLVPCTVDGCTALTSLGRCTEHGGGAEDDEG